MFAIHSLSGLHLRGPLEQISRSDEARKLRRGDTEYESSLVDTEAMEGGYRALADKYREMLPKALDRGPVRHAWQVMSRRIVRVLPDDLVETAWKVLVECRVRQAVVIDPGRQIVGLVSERDILTCLNVEAGQVRDVLGKCVAEVMTSPVVSADPVTDVRRIARAMVEFGLSGVPVVEESGRMVGFVSRGDILRAVVNDPPLSLWV